MIQDDVRAKAREVIQADRDAAASTQGPSVQAEIIRGMWDARLLVQAFTAHRLAFAPQGDRKAIAVELAGHFAARPWCEMAPDRGELRRLFRQNPTPTNPFDPNEPTQDDCLAAADAILAALSSTVSQTGEG